MNQCTLRYLSGVINLEIFNMLLLQYVNHWCVGIDYRLTFEHSKAKFNVDLLHVVYIHSYICNYVRIFINLNLQAILPLVQYLLDIYYPQLYKIIIIVVQESIL